jgi:hypothetical protein
MMMRIALVIIVLFAAPAAGTILATTMSAPAAADMTTR